MSLRKGRIKQPGTEEVQVFLGLPIKDRTKFSPWDPQRSAEEWRRAQRGCREDALLNEGSRGGGFKSCCVGGRSKGLENLALSSGSPYTNVSQYTLNEYTYSFCSCTASFIRGSVDQTVPKMLSA